jgi:hypothetical protein
MIGLAFAVLVLALFIMLIVSYAGPWGLGLFVLALIVGLGSAAS